MAQVELGNVERERVRPKKLAAVGFDNKHSTAFAHRDDDIPLLTTRKAVADPFHMLGIRINPDTSENAFLVVIGIPIVARKLLEMPFQLASCDIQRNC